MSQDSGKVSKIHSQAPGQVGEGWNRGSGRLGPPSAPIPNLPHPFSPPQSPLRTHPQFPLTYYPHSPPPILPSPNLPLTQSPPPTHPPISPHLFSPPPILPTHSPHPLSPIYSPPSTLPLTHSPPTVPPKLSFHLPHPLGKKLSMMRSPRGFTASAPICCRSTRLERKFQVGGWRGREGATEDGGSEAREVPASPSPQVALLVAVQGPEPVVEAEQGGLRD